MFDLLKQGMGMSLVRHTLTWGSGILVAKGTISADMATQLVSLAMGVAGLVLSVQDKKATQSRFFGLKKDAESEKKQSDADWLRIQQDLSDLREENKRQREVIERPAPTLEQRAEGSRGGPQARYQQVSVAGNRGFMMSHSSRQKMQGVHPLLTQVVETAMGLSAVDFKVTEGVRSAERQAELLADGRSWVKTSKHQADPTNGLGHAVDVMALPTPEGSWDWEHYEQINDAMQAASKIHNARITWGGCWATKDGCHFQLDSETT